MNVYVIEQFSRNDEYVEYGSEVIATYSNLESAIKHARHIVAKNMNYYGHGREEEPEDNIKFYFCLDKDPDDEAEYPDCMIIKVVEHKLQSDFIDGIKLNVTEKCLLDTGNDEEKYGLRHYIYQTNQQGFLAAVEEMGEKWDINNILSGEDDFKEPCLNSMVIKVEMVEED